MLWLWCRLAAVVPIQPLARELPYAWDAALKRPKKKGGGVGKCSCTIFPGRRQLEYLWTRLCLPSPERQQSKSNSGYWKYPQIVGRKGIPIAVGQTLGMHGRFSNVFLLLHSIHLPDYLLSDIFYSLSPKNSMVICISRPSEIYSISISFYNNF